jgi:thioredoxin reductase (NADPH)
MLDCIIVGSGPAGLSAALTLQANGKTFEVFGSEDLSQKIVRAEKIHNYLGLSDVSGRAFCDAIKEQLKAAKISQS